MLAVFKARKKRLVVWYAWIGILNFWLFVSVIFEFLISCDW